MTTNKSPTHGVYVVEGAGDGSYWTKVGAAWPTNNGKGFTIQLIGLPVSGRLILQEINAKRDDE
ncbi:hypothetical protein [Ensifer soli]|uniref:hypothetical protein n=1 Tax=Ciceribacter sp. sgz301302 TaxID=3342379 RepID=UPI0035B9A41E